MDFLATLTEHAMLDSGLKKSKNKISASKMPHIARPWDKKKTKLGGDAMTIDEMQKRLGFSI